MNLQRSPLHGAHGWALLALLIVIDIFAADSETLTMACHRALKRNPAAVVLVIAATALHLIFGADRRYSRVDPFRFVELARLYTGGAVRKYP